MVETDDDNMTLVEREGTYELVDTKSLSAARLIEDTEAASHAPEPESPPSEPQLPLKALIIDSPAVSLSTTQPVSLPTSQPISLPTTPAEATNKEIYKAFERTTPPPPSLPQSEKSNMISLHQSQHSRKSDMIPLHQSQYSRKSNIRLDNEEIEKKVLAETAFIHWKRGKDKEEIRKKKEKAKVVELEKAWNESSTVRDSPAFKSWLSEKSKQRAAERQVEKLRAQLITAELLTLDYEQTEGAYERWLKEKNKKTKTERMELNKRSHRDKAHLKQVITSLKTRWNADYHSAHYLHPNTLRTWDNKMYIMDDY